jgi:M6 family metalloprotease-like protein
VELSKSYKYYGEDAGDGSSHNIHAGEMIAEACQLAGDSIDWSQYDWDGDGEVEQVFVLYAGEGQHNSTDTYTIWPHKHSLSQSDYGTPLQIGSHTIDQYACSSEMFTKTMVSGSGVICHEFSHCFGFPEHYDAAMGSAGNFDMSKWDIMGYGNYNGNGFTPAGYTSYERMVLGWLEPIELKDGDIQIDGMRPLSEDGDAYIIYNSGNKDEYYLLENRQQTGWDASLPGRGLLILHVDFDKAIWEANGVNVVQTGGPFRNDHQRMTIFHADNDDETTDFSLQRDPYPYSKRDSLTDHSFPAARLYTPDADGKSFMGKPITHITRNSDQTISFHFSGSNEQTGISGNLVGNHSADRQLIYRMGNAKIWAERQPGEKKDRSRRKYVGK